MTVERDRTFPAALLRKKVCSQSDMFRKFFHPKGLTVDMFYQVVRKDCFGEKIVSDPEEMQNNFW